MKADLSPRALNKHEPFVVDQLLPLILDYANTNGLAKDEAVVVLFVALANVLVIPNRALKTGIESARPMLGGPLGLQ